MSENSANSAKALERIFDLIEDELLNASGEELDEMVRGWGVDPSRATDVVQTAFKSALQLNNRNRMREAKRVGEAEIRQLLTTINSNEGTKEELLARITDILSKRRITDPKSVTLGHRNLDEYTEEDLRSLLSQLTALEKPQKP